MRKWYSKIRPLLAGGTALVTAAALAVAAIPAGAGRLSASAAEAEDADKAAGDEKPEKVVLRVCNWEEYIDEGDWDEDELIELPSADIIGENSMLEDFEEWYYDTYGIEVKVEYSTFGSNEDLYNTLTLGDVYDLICPSDYMIMKLMSQGALVPLSEEFFDTENENNYYSRGVSPYIRSVFETKGYGGEPWSKYAAGYMWGVTGIVYNPAEVTGEQASSWKILSDPSLCRQVTVKDSVRECYFAALGALKSDLLTSEEFRSDPDYAQRLEDEMNDTSPEMIARVQDYLKQVKNNVYSFESDAGKADMITGKVVANYQWSGDGVYTMDQADEDGLELAFTVPLECTNIYFDGWVIYRKGIEEDPAKQHAAEAFINFTSRPDNVIRNMYYTGFTSVLSGGDDPLIFEYADYNYGAEEDEEEAGEEGEEAGETEAEEAGEAEAEEEEEAGAEEEEEAGAAEENEEEEAGEEGEEETEEYDLSYFFAQGPEDDGDYVIVAPADQVNRQLSAAYPPKDVIDRSCIMVHFSDEQNALINQMWINIRCMSIEEVPVWGWILAAAALCGIIAMGVQRIRMLRRSGK